MKFTVHKTSPWDYWHQQATHMVSLIDKGFKLRPKPAKAKDEDDIGGAYMFTLMKLDII